MIQDLSGSWCIKGTGESMTRVDSMVPLMHHDPYILLDVLLCSIAEYFYELCRIWRARRAIQNTNNE